MTDPYVSIDTFSVSAELSESRAEQAPTTTRPSILARLPRVAPAPPKPKRIQRFDDAEVVTHGLHHPEGSDGLADATPTALPRRTPLADPTATIRIDTVSPATIDDQPSRQARPTSRPPAPTSSPPAAVAEEPVGSWLLNLEAAVLPYSRVIVLAAAIAATGLTLVLLRGARARQAEPTTAPQVSVEAPLDALASVATPADEAPLYWPGAPAAPAEAALKPLVTASTAPAPFAAGPASAWRGPAGARLTGEVRSPDAERIDVAANPQYPATTR